MGALGRLFVSILSANSLVIVVESRIENQDGYGHLECVSTQVRMVSSYIDSPRTSLKWDTVRPKVLVQLLDNCRKLPLCSVAKFKSFIGWCVSKLIHLSTTAFIIYSSSVGIILFSANLIRAHNILLVGWFVGPIFLTFSLSL